MIIVFPFQQNQATQSLQLVKIFSNSNGGANFFANGVWMLMKIVLLISALYKFYYILLYYYNAK